MLRSVESAVSEAECFELYETALCVKDGPIVEIGTYKGRSALALALALKAKNSSHKLYTVDPFVPFLDYSALLEGASEADEVKPSSAAEVEALMSRNGLSSYVQVCEATSSVVANAFQYRNPNYVAMLFIDGAHEQASVVADYAAWRHLLAPNAIIAWHDYYQLGERGGRFDGVRRTVDSLIERLELQPLRQVGSLLISRRCRPL